jgi:hypothetical protein
MKYNPKHFTYSPDSVRQKCLDLWRDGQSGVDEGTLSHWKFVKWCRKVRDRYRNEFGFNMRVNLLFCNFIGFVVGPAIVTVCVWGILKLVEIWPNLSEYLLSLYARTF